MIKSSRYQPSLVLLTLSLSSIGISYESDQIFRAVNDTAMVEITRYNEANNTSVLDADIELISESENWFEYPKAKKSYKMKARITGKTRGLPTDYGNDLFL